MRITIIMGPFGYIPPNGIGAIEKLWYDLAVEFVKSGHQVKIISKAPLNKSGNNCFDMNGINCIYVAGYKRSKGIVKDLFFDFLYSIKSLSKVRATDVLIMNTFWSPFLCCLFKYRYSVSVYNVARYPKGQFRFYRGTDMFFCVSTAIRNVLIRQIPKREDKIKMVNNPIDTTVYTYKEKQRTSDIVIMYHGRIHPEKGLELLSSAVHILRKKYPQIKLVFVGVRNISDGGGGDDYINRLDNLTEGNIIWIDPISDPRSLAEKIAACDIYCYPSVAEKGETFGVAPLEAMGIGRPVIVSSLDCFKDFVEDQVNGFVFNHRSPEAAKELSVIIEKLIRDPDLCKEIGLRAFQTSRKFSNRNIADQYLCEFKKIVDNYD